MRRDEAYLLDMLVAARDARKFASDLSRDRFEEARIEQYAIAHALQIIGEAAARVSEETRSSTPDMPWSETISGTGGAYQAFGHEARGLRLNASR